MAGYHAIAHKHDVPDEDVMATTASGAPEEKAFDMPELLHNLDLGQRALFTSTFLAHRTLLQQLVRCFVDVLDFLLFASVSL